jgi:uncharacterized protein YlxW (UPF0749 family)
MNHGEVMVVWIVAIVMIASIFKARARGLYRRGIDYRDDRQTRVENDRLRDEVSQLKERIKVLERITVDKENSLARQIDELRDR